MMLKSLRGRLFVILVSATGLIWLCATAWIFLQTRREVEHVLDTRLQEAARMVSSLAINADGPASSGGQAGAAPMLERVGYERQLSCQIWSLDGRLVARSSGAPDDSLGDEGDGFSDRQVGGETMASLRDFRSIQGHQGAGWRSPGPAGKIGERSHPRPALAHDLHRSAARPADLDQSRTWLAAPAAHGRRFEISQRRRYESGGLHAIRHPRYSPSSRR